MERGLPGTESQKGPYPRRDVFQRNMRLYQDLRWERTAKVPDPLNFFLTNYVFSFIKYFDHWTSDEAAANVYMEREWRVLGDVNFALTNVHRVFLPQSSAERFRADLPNYAGQLTFSDSISENFYSTHFGE